MTSVPTQLIVFKPEIPAPEGKGFKFLGFRASEGIVDVDTVICEYRVEGAPVAETKKFRAGAAGNIVLNRTFKRGVILQGGENLGEISTCIHEIVIKDMCASCGKDFRLVKDFKNPRESQSASVSMVHHVPELVVSSNIANEISEKDHQAVLKARKLILLVDLDQTLIHTTNKPVADSEMRPDIYQYNCVDGKYYTKLRPHTREFLERMNELFEMHIITFGQRFYAHKIAKILDEDGRYFAQRIMSRDEITSHRHKTDNISALFPSAQQRKLIVIIDDRDDVWQYSESLVRVRPYKYFSEVDDINAPGKPVSKADSKKSEKVDTKQPTELTHPPETPEDKEEKPDEPVDDKPMPIDQDEPDSDSGTDEPGTSENTLSPLTLNKDTDDILEDIERMLTDVHRAFFEHYDRTKEVTDVASIVSYLRKQIFKDEVIVLSGIVPIGVDKKVVPLYRLAILCGARIDDEITSKTTVLVAARPSTEKVRAATKRNIPIVVPEWIYACCGKYQCLPKEGHKLIDAVAAVKKAHEKPFGNQSPKLSDMEPLDPNDKKDMEDEVDQALGESSDEEEESDHDDSNTNAEDEEDEENEVVEVQENVRKAETDTDPNKEEVVAEMAKVEAEEAADYEDPVERASLLAKLHAAENDEIVDDDDDDRYRNGDIESRKRKLAVELAGADDEEEEPGDYESPAKRVRFAVEDDDEPLVEPPADDDGDDGNNNPDSDVESEDSWADDLESQFTT